MAILSQPYRLDYTGGQEDLAQLFRDADEMFQILFEAIKTSATATAAAPTSTQTIIAQLGLDGLEGEEGPMGPPGLTGPQGLAGIMGPPGLDGDTEDIDTWLYPPIMDNRPHLTQAQLLARQMLRN